MSNLNIDGVIGGIVHRNNGLNYFLFSVLLQKHIILCDIANGEKTTGSNK